MPDTSSMFINWLDLLRLTSLMLIITSPADVDGDGTGNPDILYPFGVDQGDSVAPPSDDGSTEVIISGDGFPFFDTIEHRLYINTNGDISFQSSYSNFAPQLFPTYGVQLIAPYLADIDTLVNNGRIYFRQSTNDTALLQLASKDIEQAFSTYDFSFFSAAWIFVVTWDNVTYYGGSNSTPTNTFQCVLVTNGYNSFAMFNYGHLTWTTGTSDGGNASTGLGGTAAQAGYNYGDSIHYQSINSSLTGAIVDIAEQSNVDVPGRWIFRVDDSPIIFSGCSVAPDCDLDPDTGLCAGSGLCHYSGDPHFTSFDGYKFNYQGTCKYLIASPVSDTNKSAAYLPYFEVFGRNEHRYSTNQVAWPRYVEIAYENDTIRVNRNEAAGSTATVEVNHVTVSVPHCTNNYSVYYNGLYVRFQAKTGLAVELDGWFDGWAVNVYVPPVYRGRLTGICGNFDGNANNDLIVNNINYTNSFSAFGDLFVVTDSDSDAPTSCNTTSTSPLCNPVPQSYVNRCDQLTDPTGPFIDCIRVLDAGSHRQDTTTNNDCLRDTCYNGGETGFCLNVFALVDQCAWLGYQIDCQSWQSATNCSVICPFGMTFDCNATEICVPTCENPLASQSCTRPNKGACVCPPGTLLYNGNCTSICPIGCVDNENRIRSVGEVWDDGDGCNSTACVQCWDCTYGHQLVTTNNCTVPGPPLNENDTYIVYSITGGVLSYQTNPLSQVGPGLMLVTSDNIHNATPFRVVRPCLAALTHGANITSGDCVSLRTADGSGLYVVNVLCGTLMASSYGGLTQFPLLFEVGASFFVFQTGNSFQLQSAAYSIGYYLGSTGLNQQVALQNSSVATSSGIWYFVPQTNSGNCKNVWTLIPNTRPATLGVNIGYYTPLYCRQLCLIYPNCTGVTVSSCTTSYNYDSQCYLNVEGTSSAGQRLVIDTTYNYYDLTKSFPLHCSGECLITWSRQTIILPFYPSTYSQTLALNPNDCGYQCISDLGCLGVTWSTGNCTVYSSDVYQNYIPPGSVVTLYVPSKINFCDSCSPTVSRILNASNPDAEEQPGVTGYRQCLSLCLNVVNCTGFELRQAEVCYLSLGQLNSFTTEPMSLYLVSSSTCGNGCQNKWTLFANTTSANSVPSRDSSSILSEQDCRAACIRAAAVDPSACVAVDFNQYSNSCRFSNGTLSNIELVTDPSITTGWNHFELTLTPYCN